MADISVSAKPTVTNKHEENEGKTHINIKHVSHTTVGQLLAMETKNYFLHPVFGSFASFEAFWCYVKSGCQYPELRKMHSGAARHYMANTDTAKIANFKNIIGEGYFMMLKQMHRDSLAEVLANKLPLEMYYIHRGYNRGGDIVSAVVVPTKVPKWYTQQVERVIDMIRKGESYPDVDYGCLAHDAR